jgi:hypothetical protein
MKENCVAVKSLVVIQDLEAASVLFVDGCSLKQVHMTNDILLLDKLRDHVLRQHLSLFLFRKL